MFSSKKKEEYTAPAPVIEEPVAEPVVEEAPAPAKVRTLIGSGIKFVGNIEASEDIEINGTVEGDIISGNTITVTRSGVITGNIKVAKLMLQGIQEGNAEIQDACEISSTGIFHGNMKVSTLVTEDGAEFEGHLSLKKAVKAYTADSAEEKESVEDFFASIESAAEDQQ